MRDICPSRDDAQPHIFDGKDNCTLCGTPKPKPVVIVEIIESERGWGQKVEETHEFPTRQEAEQFCREYNRKNNPPMDEAPDWYMYARIRGDEFGPMLR